MMSVFYLASANKNKVKEIQSKLNGIIEVRDLSEFNLAEDIPETGSTLEENALIKARFVYANYHVNCFSDDSGLEVKSLNNEPGVYSARYAGEPKDDQKNMDKLLRELEGKTDRLAQFRTVIALIQGGKEHLFEGIIKGKIIHEKRGNSGFGYDPVFVPDGFDKTFAEMTLEEKNTISHRAMAIQKLANFLKGN